MTKHEFIKEFKILCNYFSKDIKDKNILRIYYDEVKDKSIEEFKIQINEFIKTNKFMPKVVDFSKGNNRSNNYKERQYTEEYLESFYDN